MINLGINGRIPADWIPEADSRLSLYLRLARLTSRQEQSAFEEELIDRFGEEPEDASILLRIANVPTAIAFTPRVEPTKKAVAEAGLVARNGRLILEEAIPGPPERLARVEEVLGQLAGGRKRA